MAETTCWTVSSPSWWSASSVSWGSTHRNWHAGVTQSPQREISYRNCRLYTHKMICKMMQFKVRCGGQIMSQLFVQGWVEGQDANSLGLHPAGQLHLRHQPLHPQLHVQPQWSAGQTWQVLKNVGWKGKLSQIVTVIKQHEGKILNSSYQKDKMWNKKMWPMNKITISQSPGTTKQEASITTATRALTTQRLTRSSTVPR